MSLYVLICMLTCPCTRPHLCSYTCPSTSPSTSLYVSLYVSVCVLLRVRIRPSTRPHDTCRDVSVYNGQAPYLGVTDFPSGSSAGGTMAAPVPPPAATTGQGTPITSIIIGQKKTLEAPPTPHTHASGDEALSGEGSMRRELQAPESGLPGSDGGRRVEEDAGSSQSWDSQVPHAPRLLYAPSLHAQPLAYSAPLHAYPSAYALHAPAVPANAYSYYPPAPPYAMPPPPPPVPPHPYPAGVADTGAPNYHAAQGAVGNGWSGGARADMGERGRGGMDEEQMRVLQRSVASVEMLVARLESG